MINIFTELIVCQFMAVPLQYTLSTRFSKRRATLIDKIQLDKDINADPNYNYNIIYNKHLQSHLTTISMQATERYTHSHTTARTILRTYNNLSERTSACGKQINYQQIFEKKFFFE